MSAHGAAPRISATPEVLMVEWADGSSGEFASVWLRDNLPQDRDPHSGQRLVDVADLPERPRIRRAVARDGCGAHRVGGRERGGDLRTRLARRAGAKRSASGVPRRRGGAG